MNLEQLFKDYYKKHGFTATHIFIYSEYQKGLGGLLWEDVLNSYVNGVEYTEMRSRDASDLDFVVDAQIVAVGRYDDAKTTQL